jgi:hypothetical protein
MPFDPSNDDDAWWNNPGPLRLTIHPAAPSNPPFNPPSNAPLVPGANYNDWARRNGLAGGADLPNDWFVPQPSAPSASGGDSLPDDWFVPQPSSSPSATQPPSGPQSIALDPGAPNPPATPRDPFEAYWSLIPASRAGAFAWHPPIFLNSAGQFPPPAPTYDPPVLPAYGLFGGVAKMPAVFAAANARPIGGGGLFDSLAGLPAANTDAPPSIFGAMARPPYAAPMPGSNPSLSPSYPPYLGGSALPSYLADPPPPPDPTLFAWLPQLQGPTAADDPPPGPSNSDPGQLGPPGSEGTADLGTLGSDKEGVQVACAEDGCVGEALLLLEAIELARLGYKVYQDHTGQKFVTGPYGQLSGGLPAGWQAHHLNQNAVYGEIIPRDEGLSVGMRGNAFNEPGTSHFTVHQSMEQFWEQYRKDGKLFNEAPTNAEYGEASRRALIAGGLSPAQATELTAQAAAQRAAYGLSETSKVPRVPGRINQTQK